jgi:hypothetical protein
VKAIAETCRRDDLALPAYAEQQGYERDFDRPLRGVLEDIENSTVEFSKRNEGIGEKEIFMKGIYPLIGNSNHLTCIAISVHNHRNWTMR